MRKYLFVVNPVAGGSEKEILQTKIETFCKKNHIQGELYQTTGKDDCKKVFEMVRHFHPEILIISGGDGTINEMIPVLLKHSLPLGIIPSGSANGLATEFDITHENAFTTLMDRNFKKMDVVVLDDSKHMIHLADFGLNAMMIKRYEEEERRGFLGYAISALKEMGSVEEPFVTTVKHGGKKYKFSTKFLVIANARKYGTGFEINPGGDISDGKVELCFLKELSIQLFIDQFVRNDRRSNENNFFDILSIDEAEVICQRPVDFQSDGKYLGKLETLKIKILDQKVEVIIPT